MAGSLWGNVGAAWKGAFSGAGWGTEKALAKTFAAGFSSMPGKSLASKIMAKGATAGLVYGAGSLAAEYVTNVGERRRAYIGDREFQGQYGSSFDVASGITRTAGLVGAAYAAYKVGGSKATVDKARRYRAAKRSSDWMGGLHSTDPRSYARYERNVGRLDKYRDKSIASRISKRLTGRDTSGVSKARKRFSAIATGALVGGAAYMAGPAVTAGVIGVGVAAGMGYIANKERKLVSKAGVSWSSMAMGGSAFVAGSAAGWNMPLHAAAEGDIKSIEDRTSVVDRMNYSTAGLVQALHTNRKAF